MAGLFDLLLSEYAMHHGQHIGTGGDQLAAIFRGYAANGYCWNL